MRPQGLQNKTKPTTPASFPPKLVFGHILHIFIFQEVFVSVSIGKSVSQTTLFEMRECGLQNETKWSLPDEILKKLIFLPILACLDPVTIFSIFAVV